jgi:hypothetical protein
MLIRKFRGVCALAFILLASCLGLTQSAPAKAASAFFVNLGTPIIPPTTCADNMNNISGVYNQIVGDGMTYSMIGNFNGTQVGPFTGTYSAAQSGSGSYAFTYFYTPASYPYNVQWQFTLKAADGTPLTRATISFTCAGAGIITNLVATNVDLTLPQPGLAFNDGRCNQDAWQSVAVYSDHKGGYIFYALYNSVGYPALQLTKTQLEANPDKGTNYLIAENLGVRVYRLIGGALQVNRVAPDQREYTFILSSCG